MSLRFSALTGVVVVCLLGACAKGSEIDDGIGGSSSDGGAGGAHTTTSTKSSTTAQGSTSATSTNGATTTTTTGAVTSSSSGVTCGMTEHVCGGVCTGNTIQSGCFGSASCAPCPAAPLHGTENCSAAGQCSFSCDTNYVPSGGQCLCSLACCSDADCNSGDTCVGGQCQTACDSGTCQATCTFTCAIQMKFGVGQCQGSMCACICI